MTSPATVVATADGTARSGPTHCRFGYFLVPADRYGGQVSTAGTLPGRISGFVQWLVRTPWPVFLLSQLQADIIGALLVLGFLRYGLPPEDRIELQRLPALNLATFAGSVVVLFLLGTAISARSLVPVFRWQRRDSLLADTDPAATELARSRALRTPVLPHGDQPGLLAASAAWSSSSPAGRWPSTPHRWWPSPPPWAPPPPRSSAICSPSGCCARWPSPRCAAGCRRTSGHRG